MRMVFNRKSW